ncbi:hypothetical protein [Flavobacterium sp.]|jgi:hypothetical protein|uniref:hypothetical protein n=1 Tax=Flavobacterium sp. TaxID=239 RepID=UPI003340B623
MKINSKIHGTLDYASVLFLWASPTLFGLPENTSYFTYVLGFIHLTLTILTDFDLGLIKVIPLKIHGIIEAVVAVLLGVTALFLGSIEGTIARNFYLIFAVVLAGLWFLTEYKKNTLE